MKKILLISILATAAAASSSLAQDFVVTQPRTPQVSTRPYTHRLVREGGLQHAARRGNLLQAINPFAPREYGTGAEFVEYRLDDPFLRPRDPSREHPIALRLFAFEF